MIVISKDNLAYLLAGETIAIKDNAGNAVVLKLEGATKGTSQNNSNKQPQPLLTRAGVIA